MKRCNRVFALAIAAAAVCSQAATAQPKADRYYNLEFKPSGKLVYTDATENLQDIKLGGPIPEGREDQYAFKLVTSPEKGYFNLLHKSSGKYLCTGANAEARVFLFGPIGNNQEDMYRFKLFDAGEGYYYLLHKLSGRYVFYYVPKDKSGVLALYGPVPENDQDAYKFRFTPAATAAGSGK